MMIFFRKQITKLKDKNIASDKASIRTGIVEEVAEEEVEDVKAIEE